MSYLRIAFCFAAAFVIGSNSYLPTTVHAYEALPNESDAKQLGLTVQWQASAEANRVGFGETSSVVWPHSRLRKQKVVVKVGDRTIEEIDANELVVEPATAQTVSTKGATAAKSSEPKRLGMDGARERAALTVKRYSRLGKTARTEEIDEPMIFLVSASNDGGVQALDAETGEQLWSSSVGRSKLPTFGPGVNDRFVALLNGNDLYVMDLLTGRMIGKRRVKDSPSAPPLPVDFLIYVPSSNGTMAAYEAENMEAEPITMRFTGALSASAVASIDQRYVAWNEKNNLQIAQAGRSFAQWNRLESAAPFRAPPQAIGDGFVSASMAGMVFRVNQKQANSLVWRENTAMQITRPLLASGGLVMAVADSGACLALDEATGEVQWRAETFDVERVLAVTQKQVYAQLRGSQLVALDRRTGRTVAIVNRRFASGVPNPINDRVYLRSITGSIVCLREFENDRPIPNPSRVVPTEIAKAKPSTPSTDPLADPAMTSDPSADPFNAPATPAPANAPMSDDPFGAPPSSSPPSNPADPFGG